MSVRHWHNRLVLCAAACVAAAAAADAGQPDHIAVAVFSAIKPGATLPDYWKPLGASNTIPRTQYTLVDDGGTTVLRADARAAASGLSRTIRIDPALYPVLRWRWKVSNVLKSSDIRTKAGDDYPARIYVMFDYPLEKLSFADRTKLRLARTLHDPHLPAATLCYVWDSKAAVGTIVPSAYTDRVRLIVVDSGTSDVNRWRSVDRDVAADFRAAFGDAAPPVSGVAIATDTDNTGEAASAFYGDISFYKQRLMK